MTGRKIRRRQLEKARWIVRRNSQKYAFEVYDKLEAAFKEEFKNKPVEFSFVPVTSAFLNVADSAQKANETIANLIPNIRKKN